MLVLIRAASENTEMLAKSRPDQNPDRGGPVSKMISSAASAKRQSLDAVRRRPTSGGPAKPLAIAADKMDRVSRAVGHRHKRFEKKRQWPLFANDTHRAQAKDKPLLFDHVLRARQTRPFGPERPSIALVPIAHKIATAGYFEIWQQAHPIAVDGNVTGTPPLSDIALLRPIGRIGQAQLRPRQIPPTGFPRQEPSRAHVLKSWIIMFAEQAARAAARIPIGGRSGNRGSVNRPAIRAGRDGRRWNLAFRAAAKTRGRSGG